MDSIGLPMVPDLEAFSRPIRYLILAVLVLGPLLFAVLVLLGTASTPTVVVEATVVDSVPERDEEEVYQLSEFLREGPVRTAVEKALQDGSGSVRTTVEEIRSDPEFYVKHDGRVVHVIVTKK